MDTTNQPTTPVHPLVEKAARKWLELAARHGVPAIVLRGECEFAPEAVSIQFDTGDGYERCHVAIYPPTTPGRTVRQSPILCQFYRTFGRRTTYGVRPGTTLSDVRNHLKLFWGRNHARASREQVAA